MYYVTRYYIIYQYYYWENEFLETGGQRFAFHRSRPNRREMARKWRSKEYTPRYMCGLLSESHTCKFRITLTNDRINVDSRENTIIKVTRSKRGVKSRSRSSRKQKFYELSLLTMFIIGAIENRNFPRE